MTRKRILLYVLLLLIMGMIITIYLCNKPITDATNNKTYTDSNTIPYNKVGLLLETSKYIQNGNQNHY